MRGKLKWTLPLLTCPGYPNEVFHIPDSPFPPSCGRLSCAVFNLGHPFLLPAFCRPREVYHGNDEEAVRRVRDTSKGVIPCKEGGTEAEIPASFDQCAIGSA